MTEPSSLDPKPEQSSGECSIDIVIPAKDAGLTLISNTEKWLRQRLPSPWTYHLYLVDDGSRDGVPARIAERFPSRITVIFNATPRGRSSACNAGARKGQGRLIAFFDADCAPESDYSLAAYVTAIESGAQVAFGRLDAIGDGLWARYFREVSENRRQRFLAGDDTAMTTANCIIERALFERVGMFDERYRQYGFEDRDLIARLMAFRPRAEYVAKAAVIHDDSLTLDSVAHKMMAAGQYTSGIFMQDHPILYNQMAFARADVRCRPRSLRIFASTLEPTLPLLLRGCRLLLSLPLGYRIKATIIKLCSAAFFLSGTNKARHSAHVR